MRLGVVAGALAAWIVGCSLVLDTDVLREDRPADTATETAADTAVCTDDAPCDDAIACTVDQCDRSGRCVHLPDNRACPDDAVCDPSAGCVARGTACVRDGDCDDDIACTVDACAQGACRHIPDDAACAEANAPCQAPAVCSPVLGCVAGDPIQCPPAQAPCSQSLCNPVSGQCEEVRILDADDDSDGYLDAACGGDDCGDTDPLVHPFAAERCNQEDDDCDGVVDWTWNQHPVSLGAGTHPVIAVSADGAVAATWQAGLTALAQHFDADLEPVHYPLDVSAAVPGTQEVAVWDAAPGNGGIWLCVGRRVGGAWRLEVDTWSLADNRLFVERVWSPEGDIAGCTVVGDGASDRYRIVFALRTGAGTAFWGAWSDGDPVLLFTAPDDADAATASAVSPDAVVGAFTSGTTGREVVYLYHADITSGTVYQGPTGVSLAGSSGARSPHVVATGAQDFALYIDDGEEDAVLAYRWPAATNTTVLDRSLWDVFDIGVSFGGASGVLAWVYHTPTGNALHVGRLELAGDRFVVATPLSLAVGTGWIGPVSVAGTGPVVAVWETADDSTSAVMGTLVTPCTSQ